MVLAVVCLLGLAACAPQIEQKAAAEAPTNQLAPTVIINVSPAPTASVAVAEVPNAVAIEAVAPVVPSNRLDSLNLPDAARELVQLFQSGVGDDVVLAYLNKSTNTYSLSSEQVVKLKELGLSADILVAMLSKQSKPMDVVVTNPAPAMVTAPNPAPQPVPAPASPIQPVVPATTPPPAVQETAVNYVDYNYYEEPLNPHGAWFVVGDYGYVWQPTVAVINPLWRPYCHGGRWLSTDCGWYWQSDYTWGWAAFHYGRWHQHKVRGWVWVPDRTWGPAWVTWRYSDSHCGWAPLPPGTIYTSDGFRYHNNKVGFNHDFGLSHSHYSFVPMHRFTTSSLHTQLVPASQAHDIFNRTTVINNYVSRGNNLVVNMGVDHAILEKALRQPITRHRVVDIPAGSSLKVRADGIGIFEDRPSIYRKMIGDKPERGRNIPRETRTTSTPGTMLSPSPAVSFTPAANSPMVSLPAPLANSITVGNNNPLPSPRVGDPAGRDPKVIGNMAGKRRNSEPQIVHPALFSGAKAHGTPPPPVANKLPVANNQTTTSSGANTAFSTPAPLANSVWGSGINSKLPSPVVGQPVHTKPTSSLRPEERRGVPAQNVTPAPRVPQSSPSGSTAVYRSPSSSVSTGSSHEVRSGASAQPRTFVSPSPQSTATYSSPGVNPAASQPRTRDTSNSSNGGRDNSGRRPGR
jgi:hypothetical protein